MEFTWEPGFEIRVSVQKDGATLISANRQGLVSLANNLLALSLEKPVEHFHLDEHNSLEDGSSELIVELVEG